MNIHYNSDGLYEPLKLNSYKYYLIIDKHFKVGVNKAPNLFNRFFIRVILGWKYEVIEEHI